MAGGLSLEVFGRRKSGCQPVMPGMHLHRGWAVGSF